MKKKFMKNRICNSDYRLILLFFGVLLTAVFFSFSVVGAAEAEREHPVVRVGYFANENFQEGLSDDAVKSGYTYEYLRKIAYYSGWKYDYVYGEWYDLFEQLKRGEIDIMAGISRTEEREEFIAFPDYEMGREIYYLYKHESDTEISGDNLSAFSDKKIGGIKDTMMVACLRSWAKENNINLEIIEYSGFTAEKKAFDDGEIDGLVETDYNISADSGRIPVIKIGESPYYLAVTKTREDLLEELNDAIAKLNRVEPYFLQKLQYNYYGDSAANNMLTEDEQRWIDKHSVINVGYFESYMPYSGTDSDGNATGLLTDVMDEMLKKLNIESNVKVHYQTYNSYNELVENLHSGRIDAAFPVSGEIWNAERDGIFASSSVVAAGVDLTFMGSFNDHTTASIAVNNNNKMQYYYTTSNFPNARIVFCNSVEDCLQAVLHGEAGSTILNGIRTNSLL